MTDLTARRIGISIVAVALIMVAALALWRTLRTRRPHVDVDRSVYPVAGVDLSSHNGLVDFDSLAHAGIDFAYLKASEGNTFRDHAFALNSVRARRAGLHVGAYHFFRFDCDGATQCANLLEAVEGFDTDLPMAIDLEEWSNPADITTALVRERLDMMVTLLHRHGHRVVIYTNKQGYARFLRGYAGVAGSVDTWICSFTSPPLGHEPWQLWQHSHVGDLPGVGGYVDLNTFNGSRSQWRQWVDSCMSLDNKKAVDNVIR